jgi:predicted dehydrogenase
MKGKTMAAGIARRGFFGQAAATGAALSAASPASAAWTRAKRKLPADKLGVGVIGVANRGAANLDGVSGENIVALCDVDTNYLAAAAARFPSARPYTDYRKMLEQPGLDAVVISAPDHVHAPAASIALQFGLHVYCEKPLTHSVHEARVLAQLAKKHRRATQLGTQIHAEDNYRRVVEVVQADAIGTIREVHVWCGGGHTSDGRPKEQPPVPETLYWDQWLAPAPYRPYHPVYVPFNWRGWWDFGSGTLGDMACHHMDLPYWALDLRHPSRVEAEGPAVHPECCPVWLIVRYDYPARGAKPPVRLTWYNGDRRPPQFAQGLLPEWGNGTLFVGDKGMLLADYGRYALLPERDFAGFVLPAQSIPKSTGHYNEWIDACKTGSPTTCNFDYSGALTEAVLLGNVAYRLGKALDWDASRLRATNAPEADALIRKPYRDGWGLAG